MCCSPYSGGRATPFVQEHELVSLSAWTVLLRGSSFLYDLYTHVHRATPHSVPTLWVTNRSSHTWQVRCTLVCVEEQPILVFLHWVATYATVCDTRSAVPDLDSSERFFVVESPIAPPAGSGEPPAVRLLSTSEQRYVSWAHKRVVRRVNKQILEKYTDKSRQSADPDDAVESVSSISSAGREAL